MKKILLVAGLALFGTASAQTFGIKGGVNVSSISGEDTKAKVGFGGGLFMNAPIAESFSIQPEILYNMKGAESEGGIDASIKLDYISVPVMFQYNATPQFYLEAGPEFSFLTSAKLKLGNESGDVKELFKSFDLGIGIGAGYYFTPNFGLTARYVAGVTEVLHADADSSDKSTNNVFSVGLAYKFGK